MWPFTEWGAGSTPAKALEPTVEEFITVEALERRSGRRVRDGESLHWVGVWPFRRLER